MFFLHSTLTTQSQSQSQEFTQSDLHMQRLARLEFEFLQRKNLAAELKSVRGRCEEMQNEIEEKRRKLNSINPMLLSIIEVRSLHTRLVWENSL